MPETTSSKELDPKTGLYTVLDEEITRRVAALPSGTEYDYNPDTPGDYVNLDGEDLVRHPSPLAIFGADEVSVVCLSRVKPGHDQGRGLRAELSNHNSVVVYLELFRDGEPFIPYPVNPISPYKHPANAFQPAPEHKDYEIITRPDSVPVLINATWERPVANSPYDYLNPENMVQQAIDYGAAHELSSMDITELLRIIAAAATSKHQ